MESIWQDFQIPRKPPLPGDIRTDVLIIGGGICGLLCAYLLKQEGIRCVVAEARKIADGTTGNTTAKITAQHGLICHKLTQRFGAQTAARYLQANQQAVDAFRQLCKTMDCDYSEQDHYIYSRSDRKILEQELAALQSLGFPAEMAEVLPLPFPVAGAVRFPRQGQFHPLKFLRAIAEDLTIFENTTVQEIGKHCALTNRGKICAEHIIVATHFPFLNKHGSYFLKQYQQRSYVLALENAPQFAGMYLDEQENGLSFRHYGNSLLLGGCGHRTGKTGGGWKALEQYAAEYYPDARITHRWAAQDCMTLDDMPYIGAYSKNTRNLYVATGFNKWGMTGSMVSAKLLTDLVQHRPNPYMEVFSPSRSMLHRQLGVNLLESAWNILTPTAPRCPHLGCALKWNSQEHSWDCPCHGSRFTEDGTLIDNPATGNLRSTKKRK